MKVYTQVLTFGSTPVQIAAASTTPSAANISLTNVSLLYVESLASNTHNAYVGTQAVTNDGSGTGVISQLAIPAATESTNGVRLPFYELYLPNNGVDVTQFYFHGNLGEKVKVSFFVQD